MDIQEMFKHSLLRSFHSDNILINTFLTCIVVSATSFIFSKLNRLKAYFKKLIDFLRFKNDRTAELEFTCEEVNSYYSCTRMAGSKNFKALLWLIKDKLKADKINGLKYIKEFNDKDEDNYNDSDDDNNDILYIVNQEEEFSIQDEIYEDINFEFSSMEKSNSDDKKVRISHSINLFSKNNSLCYLQNYVENVKKDYINYLYDLVNKKQHIFELERESEDGEIEYSIYPFNTTCSIDKIYFDEKEEILNQIYFFKDNKSWYEKHGKPYTLGICSYGEPGCGKTSFEKCLTKMLDRHMIKVDLSKIKNKRMANKLFFSEKLGEYTIPYEKRMYVFSEVDRMSDILFNEEFKKNKSDISEKTKNQPVIINNSSKDDYIKVKEDKNSFNLQHVLDILDGIPERTGQIIMMSTNNFEKLDPALIRPGRIDCPIEFKKCNSENTKKLLEDYFEKKVENSTQFPNRKFTPAEIFQICSKYNDINKVINKINQ